MMLRYLFPGALLVVLVSSQSPPPQGPILGCTTNSFVLPSWFIHGLRYLTSVNSSTNGNVFFSLLNRATNYTADMGCQVKGGGWHTCSIQGRAWSNDTLQTSIKLDKGVAYVSVHQTWTCNDRKGAGKTPFVATGNNSVALNCTGGAGQTQACVAVDSPLLVKGSLLSPVAITPAYSEGPPGHSTPGCMAAAQNPSWTLSLIYYTSDAGDEPNLGATQTFNLLVTNPATGYQAGCMHGSPSGNLVCAGQEFGALAPSRYRPETDASFDPSTMRFTINQTWFCDDIDPGKPVQIQATGSDILPLKCTSMPSEDGGDSNGNKTACTNDADVILHGKLVSEDPLPPYSIEDPVLTPDGCTLSSIFHPQWTFSAFEVDSNAGTRDNHSASISFDIILNTPSPGFQFPKSVVQDTEIANSSWYRCALGAGGDTGQPLWPQDCSLQYDSGTKELTVKADWICSDLDPNNPILFSGIATTKVDSPLACSVNQGVSQCITEDATYSWNADITNVTWHPASK